MAHKSRFGVELTEKEIDALVNNTTPRNNKEEYLILEFLITQLFYSGLLDIKMIVTNLGASALLVIYQFISSTPS